VLSYFSVHISTNFHQFLLFSHDEAHDDDEVDGPCEGIMTTYTPKNYRKNKWSTCSNKDLQGFYKNISRYTEDCLKQGKKSSRINKPFYCSHYIIKKIFSFVMSC